MWLKCKKRGAASHGSIGPKGLCIKEMALHGCRGRWVAAFPSCPCSPAGKHHHNTITLQEWGDHSGGAEEGLETAGLRATAGLCSAPILHFLTEEFQSVGILGFPFPREKSTNPLLSKSCCASGLWGGQSWLLSPLLWPWSLRAVTNYPSL